MSKVNTAVSANGIFPLFVALLQYVIFERTLLLNNSAVSGANRHAYESFGPSYIYQDHKLNFKNNNDSFVVEIGLVLAKL